MRQRDTQLAGGALVIEADEVRAIDAIADDHYSSGPSLTSKEVDALIDRLESG